MSVFATTVPEKNYLNAAHTVRSWLLTVDHKRIAVLYLFSITFFFLIGGLSAALFAPSSSRRTGTFYLGDLQSVVHRPWGGDGLPVSRSVDPGDARKFLIP